MWKQGKELIRRLSDRLRVWFVQRIVRPAAVRWLGSGEPPGVPHIYLAFVPFDKRGEDEYARTVQELHEAKLLTHHDSACLPVVYAINDGTAVAFDIEASGMLEGDMDVELRVELLLPLRTLPMGGKAPGVFRAFIEGKAWVGTDEVGPENGVPDTIKWHNMQDASTVTGYPTWKREPPYGHGVRLEQLVHMRRLGKLSEALDAATVVPIEQVYASKRWAESEWMEYQQNRVVCAYDKRTATMTHDYVSYIDITYRDQYGETYTAKNRLGRRADGKGWELTTQHGVVSGVGPS